MPTITDRRPRRGLPIAPAAAALAGWLGVTALTALAVQPETVVALGNPAALAAADDGALVSAGRAYLVIRPAAPGAVRRLYAGGAWLVLPAPGTGCLGAR
ncbi:hypothetical protein GGQ91_004723 [Methylobacterium fujisawaense]|uniref:Uncharacterized protein n=1 Tax=Methylobacterium fujisawaense TaxID=107400 RepID=A0ABR6DGT0_9HYPH|nr:hypothetical protein [Methylobacterium fujisawaense]MBA9065306.1 hypothetical protein [Methylobacterium fujisawaense]